MSLCRLGIGFQHVEVLDQPPMLGSLYRLTAQWAQRILAIFEMRCRDRLEPKQRVFSMPVCPLVGSTKVARRLLQGRFQGLEVLRPNPPGEGCDPFEDGRQVVGFALSCGVHI